MELRQRPLRRPDEHPRHREHGPGGGYVGYARGTDSARRGLAWVGENGPELVRFRGGEQVIPNHRLAGAGAATYVFSPTYRDDGQSVRRDMEAWERELRRAGI